MSKRYYDIFIRPTSATPISSEMIDMDRLELPATGAKLIRDGITVECGDGSKIVDGESVEFEGGTMRVDRAEWGYLKTIYHGKFADVALMDSAQADLRIDAYRLRMSIAKIAESGKTIICKITGKRDWGIDAPLSLIAQEVDDTLYISGTVYEAGGVNIVKKASVLITSVNGTAVEEEPCVSDKDGNFFLGYKAPRAGLNKCTIATTHISQTFSTVTVAANTGQITEFDIVAES